MIDVYVKKRMIFSRLGKDGRELQTLDRSAACIRAYKTNRQIAGKPAPVSGAEHVYRPAKESL
jgi:hypothetical protein